MSLSYQIFIYLFILLVSMEAHVRVTTNGDGADKDGLIPNSTAIVICTITPYTGTMTWEIDGKVVADCAITDCKTYKTLSFAFGFDTDKGIFTITIDPVKYSYNGKKLKCDDGFTAAYTTLLVKGDSEDVGSSVNEGIRVLSRSQTLFIMIAGLELKNQLFT